MSLINDWNQRQIPTAKSRNGKVSVCNYEDNLIVPSRSVWPHNDLLKKLYRSNHENDFDKTSLDVLTAKLGFYCDLQSLRSEDAITWSVFGTLNCFQSEQRIDFVNSILGIIGEKPDITDCSIQLWARIAHPDTLVSGGPEIDFQIISDKVIILGECKWASKIGENQGKEKNKNQLQLRKEYLSKYGKGIFPKVNRQIVMAVTQEKLSNIECPTITWEDICSKTIHPLKPEISRYYTWKKAYGL